MSFIDLRKKKYVEFDVHYSLLIVAVCEIKTEIPNKRELEIEKRDNGEKNREIADE